MHVTMNFGYRIGIVLLAMFLSICSGGGFQEARADERKIWKPTKPIKIVIHAYGAAYDWTARQIGKVLPDYLGQKVIIQAIPGAAGANALDAVHNSKPDGHTVNLTPFGTYLNLSMKSLYSWDVKDMPIILTIDTRSYAVFAGTKSPFASYEDIVKMKEVVRIAQGGANFAIIPLLEDFEKKGVQYKLARFKGLSDATMAVIAGNADILISPLSGFCLDKVRAGDLRAPLWVYDTKRFPLYPNMPTVVDLGMPKEYASYHLFRLMQVAPGTPDYIQKGLRAGLTKALQDKRTIAWSQKFETPVDTVPDKELTETIRILVKGFKEHPKIVEAYF